MYKTTWQASMNFAAMESAISKRVSKDQLKINNSKGKKNAKKGRGKFMNKASCAISSIL